MYHNVSEKPPESKGLKEIYILDLRLWDLLNESVIITKCKLTQHGIFMLIKIFYSIFEKKTKHIYFFLNADFCGKTDWNKPKML